MNSTSHKTLEFICLSLCVSLSNLFLPPLLSSLFSPLFLVSLFLECNVNRLKYFTLAKMNVNQYKYIKTVRYKGFAFLCERQRSKVKVRTMGHKVNRASQFTLQFASTVSFSLSPLGFAGAGAWTEVEFKSSSLPV